MMITYRTVVLHVPPSPMGLVPERWMIEHRCSLCRHGVTSEQLIAHAQGHERAEYAGDDESFAIPGAVGHNGGQSDPTEDPTALVPPATSTTNDQRRR